MAVFIQAFTSRLLGAGHAYRIRTPTFHCGESKRNADRDHDARPGSSSRCESRYAAQYGYGPSLCTPAPRCNAQHSHSGYCTHATTADSSGGACRCAAECSHVNPYRAHALSFSRATAQGGSGDCAAE